MILKWRLGDCRCFQDSPISFASLQVLYQRENEDGEHVLSDVQGSPSGIGSIWMLASPQAETWPGMVTSIGSEVIRMEWSTCEVNAQYHTFTLRNTWETTTPTRQRR